MVYRPGERGSNNLSLRDQDRLRNILVRVFQRPDLDSSAGRLQFLESAGLSTTWLANFRWDGVPHFVAGQLLDSALDIGFPLQEGRRGHTMLGAILDEILRRELVGFVESQYIASLIVRYKLIRLERPNVKALTSWQLQALLQFVPAPSEEVEAVVRPRMGADQFMDAVWLDLGASSGRAVCRIEIGATFGTGFLVAPNLILTCYHVIEPIIRAKALYRQVVLLFGYRRGPAGVVENGQPYSLADDWLVDSSPNIPGELDYALLATKGSPGSDVVGGVQRGWLAPYCHQFEHSQDLFIIQHPQFENGTAPEPLQLVLGYNSILDEDEGGTRIRHTTNTERGSSGSPCFTADWRLVALHHGRKSSGVDSYNIAIPMCRICEQTAFAAHVRCGGVLGAVQED